MNSSDKNHLIKKDSEAQKKTSNSHPDISDLRLLSSSNDDSLSNSVEHRHSRSTILHVAECSQCQKLLTVLTSLRQSHHTIDNTTVNEGQQMLIVDYISRGFSISRKKLLCKKIQGEPSSLKAMLHYASHSEAMRLNIKQNMMLKESNSVDHLKIEKTHKKFNIFLLINRLLIKFKAYFSWSFSFNFSTIYSLFVSFLSISLLFVVLSNKPKVVATDTSELSEKQVNNNRVELEFISNELKDSSVIYALALDNNIASEKNQRQEKQSLGKVKIKLNDEQSLHIAWPVSEATNRYTLSFYALPNQTKTPELSISTTEHFIELDVKNFESGKRYRWVFSYQTLDKKEFRADGGFIIKSFASRQ